MRTRSKLVLTAIGATLLMAFAVGTASAGRLSISNQNFRVTFSDLEFTAGELRNDCHVTLEGSLHSRTINKVLGSLIGYITRVQTGQCNLGTTILTETLPWHISYEGFSGTLPEITLIIIRARGNFRVVTCLAAAEFFGRFSVEPGTHVVTGAEVPLERNEGLPLTGVLCPSPRLGNLRSVGMGSVMLLGATTRITVTLI